MRNDHFSESAKGSRGMRSIEVRGIFLDEKGIGVDPAPISKILCVTYALLNCLEGDTSSLITEEMSLSVGSHKGAQSYQKLYCSCKKAKTTCFRNIFFPKGPLTCRIIRGWYRVGVPAPVFCLTLSRSHAASSPRSSCLPVKRSVNISSPGEE